MEEQKLINLVEGELKKELSGFDRYKFDFSINKDKNEIKLGPIVVVNFGGHAVDIEKKSASQIASEFLPYIHEIISRFQDNRE